MKTAIAMPVARGEAICDKPIASDQGRTTCIIKIEGGDIRKTGATCIAKTAPHKSTSPYTRNSAEFYCIVQA